MSVKDKYTKIYLYILVSIVFMTNFGIVLDYGESFHYLMPFIWFFTDAPIGGDNPRLYIFPALANLAILSVIFYNFFKRFEIKYLKNLIIVMTILALFSIVKVGNEISLFLRGYYSLFNIHHRSDDVSRVYIDFPMFDKITYEEYLKKQRTAD